MLMGAARRARGADRGFRTADILAAVIPVLLLAGCASHEKQAVRGPLIQVRPAATAAAAPPALPAIGPSAPTVDTLFYRDPATGRTDGPFDPTTGRRVLLQPVPGGSTAVVVDAATGLPILLPDRAVPAPGWEASRRPLPILQPGGAG